MVRRHGTCVGVGYVKRGHFRPGAAARVVDLVEGEQHQAGAGQGGAVACEEAVEEGAVGVHAGGHAARVEKEAVSRVLERVGRPSHLVADPGAVRPSTDTEQMDVRVDDIRRIDAVERAGHDLVRGERLGQHCVEAGIEEPQRARGRRCECGRGRETREHPAPREEVRGSWNGKGTGICRSPADHRSPLIVPSNCAACTR